MEVFILKWCVFFCTCKGYKFLIPSQKLVVKYVDFQNLRVFSNRKLDIVVTF